MVLEHQQKQTECVSRTDSYQEKQNSFVMQLQSLNVVVFCVGAGLTVIT